MVEKKRCVWANSGELMTAYHDEEWGVPVHDDRKLFEFLILEGAQAGLNWQTVLTKRENYRKAFKNFNPLIISRYGEKEVKDLLNNSGIIRNKLKIEATINNAQKFLEVQKEFGSFDKYIWEFVGGKPLKNRWQSLKHLPAQTEQSGLMSKALKKRGFKFVGSTICYAFMQAVGMVNDHTTDCFRYNELNT